jgi:tetratricopeptide (TPR) repeat protein
MLAERGRSMLRPYKLPAMKVEYFKLKSIAIVFALLLAAAAIGAKVQDPAQDPATKQQEPAPAPPPKQGAKPNKDSATSSAPDQPIYDPLRAEKDLEVGQYYMRKGDVDAAIDRFEDAALAKPGYAVPYRFLGEAQEKKGLKKKAIKSYQRYLDLYPRAEDKEKIQKKIDKLYKEAAKEKKQS